MTVATSLERQEWIEKAKKEINQKLVEFGLPVPETRITISWPCKSPRKVLGQCFNQAASPESVFEIFLSPSLEASEQIIATLVHELLHAVHPADLHRGNFAKYAFLFGLEKPLKSINIGPSLAEFSKYITGKIGLYPCRRVDLPAVGEKKKTTRMIKCACATCGYVARTTKKWLEGVGAPHCPHHGKMEVK